MIDSDKVLIHALAGTLRVTVYNDEGAPFTYNKSMSPTAMRILSINLQQAALESERNIAFTKKV